MNPCSSVKPLFSSNNIADMELFHVNHALETASNIPALPLEHSYADHDRKYWIKSQWVNKNIVQRLKLLFKKDFLLC